MSGRIAAILPLPWLASVFRPAIAEKVLLNDLYETDGVEPPLVVLLGVVLAVDLGVLLLFVDEPPHAAIATAATKAKMTAIRPDLLFRKFTVDTS